MNAGGRSSSGVLACAVALLLLLGCGSERNSRHEGLNSLPRYPGATQSESMEQSGMLGILSGELVQLNTRDRYDDVLRFYTEALADRETEVLSHTSELGRQTAISISRDDEVLSVAIQEFSAEGGVNITLMRVGG